MVVKKAAKKAKKKTVTRKKAAKKTTKKKVTRKKASTVNLNEGGTNKENVIKPNFKPIGKSGTFVSGNVVQDDHITALIGLPGQETWAKMLRADSQVRKIFHATVNPIKSAKWSIEPASDEQIDIDCAALMEKIIFKDMPGGWKSKLDEICLYPFHGHSVFEIVHRNFTDPNFGPYTGLANMAFRDQRTLEEFKFDNDTGALLEVRQVQSGDLDVDQWMNADTLVIFFNERKGTDLGYPFCRMLYGSYKRKLLAKTLQIIGVERSAIPVPHLEIPENVKIGSDEELAARQQLENFTNAEQAYFITPHGWKLNYHNDNTFDPSKVQVVIKAENEEMAGSVVAMFLEMGIGGNSGNQAGVEGSINFFNKQLSHLADKIAEVFNTTLIPSLVRMNFGDQVKTMPEMTHSGITDDAGKELMEIVTGYTSASVITPDEQLEDHVRRKHNLPKKMEGEILDNKGTQEGGGQDDPEPTPPADNPDDEVELSTKGNPRTMITEQGERITATIREGATFTANKLINDIMKKYRQLPENKKQKAIQNIKIGGQAQLRKNIKQNLTDVYSLALAQAKREVPVKGEVNLNQKTEMFMDRLKAKYGDIDIKLNEFSSLPAHIQVLIVNQSELITRDTLQDLENRVAFQFSSEELDTNDEDIIRQKLEDTAEDMIESQQMATKGTNVAATIVNEARDTWFFAPEVAEQVHSFTFMNAAPKTAICTELAGTTFKTNDAQSLQFSPPLHHNCKSYLRANLKTSRGVDSLEVSKLAPSAKAQKDITL